MAAAPPPARPLSGDCGEPLLAELPGPFLVGAVQRRKRAGRPAQQEVSQAGIAREGGPVQVAAEHPAGVGALGAVSVADADGDLRQRAGTWPQPGHALMILEPGQPGNTKLGIDVRDDLADAAPVAPAAADVDDAET